MEKKQLDELIQKQRKYFQSGAYDIKNAIVFNNYNVSRDKNIIYYPIYMTMFIRNSRMDEYVYKLDLSDLT